MTANRESLTAERWALAALDAIAQSGIEAVAVEPLARRLGVTKGSFYWHFRNRSALLAAALKLWERRETEEILERAASEQDPRARIERLFREADGSERAGRLHLALVAACKNPQVDAAVRRVSDRRLGFLVNCYSALGLAAQEAQHWATLSYSVFLGTLQLRRDAPRAIPGGDEFRAYLQHVNRVLIPDAAASVSSDSEC